MQGESWRNRERGAAYMAEQIPREIIRTPPRILCMSEDAFGVFCVGREGSGRELVRCRGGQCSIIRNIEILSNSTSLAAHFCCRAAAICSSPRLPACIRSTCCRVPAPLVLLQQGCPWVVPARVPRLSLSQARPDVAPGMLSVLMCGHCLNAFSQACTRTKLAFGAVSVMWAAQ